MENKMENKFTPGPWTLGTKHPGRVLAKNEPLGTGFICTTSPCGDDDNPTEKEMADANLIASDPDLLAACEAAKWYLMKRPEMTDASNELLFQLDKAIAKAKGE